MHIDSAHAHSVHMDGWKYSLVAATLLSFVLHLSPWYWGLSLYSLDLRTRPFNARCHCWHCSPHHYCHWTGRSKSMSGLRLCCRCHVIKFEFTDDANFQLFAGEYIYGKMYVRTDRETDKRGSRFTHVWEAHSGLPQLIPPKLLQHNQLSVTLK